MARGETFGRDSTESVAPAVIGPEHIDDDALEEPPQVFVPCAPVKPDTSEATLELRHTTEGELALPTYTSLERLVEGCGERQPWIGVARSDVQTIAEQVGAEIVLEDVPLPDTERRTGEQ